MKMNLALTLIFTFSGLLGCKVSYNKNITPGGAWGNEYPGVYLNAKVCLEGAGTFPMSTALKNNSTLPFVTPYTLAKPWYHYSIADEALKNPGTYISLPWVDWVLVEIYNKKKDGSYSIVDAQSALLHENGSLYSSKATQSLYFANLWPGNYFINIKHRNHLAIATQNAVALSIQNYSEIDPLVFDVDFTNPQTVLTGSSSSLVGNQCLAAGDVNNDNLIDSSDLAAINSQVNAIFTAAPDLTKLNGYFAGDVNLDNSITVDTSLSTSDHVIIFANDGLTTLVHPNAL